MKVMTLKIPAELETRLAGLAARRGASKSAIAREILSAGLAAEGARAESSFAEQAADLCGCVDGPRDLATNPAYFKGFGR